MVVQTKTSTSPLKKAKTTTSKSFELILPLAPAILLFGNLFLNLSTVGGIVDMSIGGDQGGSIRMPASFCGIVGLKPTHGLVPYSGIMSMETSIDHTGPMTADVKDNALMLEAIAGPDGWDSRQINVVTHKYTDFLDQGVKDLRIGISANNIATFTKYSGQDPSIGGADTSFGIDVGNYPVTPSYMLSINIRK